MALNLRADWSSWALWIFGIIMGVLFLAAVASSEPAPGGGSVAALAGAASAALVSMVARTTLAKAAYAPAHAELAGPGAVARAS